MPPASRKPQHAYVAQERFPAIGGGANECLPRSYTGFTPRLDEAELAALPAWGPANPLFVELPSIWRCRRPSRSAPAIGGAVDGRGRHPYAAANAIEAYLRQIPYDPQSAPRPKVLPTWPTTSCLTCAARLLRLLRHGVCGAGCLAGLPARFVTGFAAGNWSPNDQQWVITEAEAHSWPEVYFPQVGWVRFEPTAYRPQPVRIGLPHRWR